MGIYEGNDLHQSLAGLRNNRIVAGHLLTEKRLSGILCEKGTSKHQQQKKGKPQSAALFHSPFSLLLFGYNLHTAIQLFVLF